MVNYQFGKLYKLVDNTNGNCYVGSTCEQYLSRRLACHVGEYRRYLTNKRKTKITSFDIIANGCYEIVLLENYPCNSIDELHERERHFIETLQSVVNKNLPNRNGKDWRDANKSYNAEYYEKNKESFKTYFGQYYKNNKEKILKMKKEYTSNNSESIKEYNKQYYACGNNAERIKANQRKSYECLCGSLITYGSKSRHNKSKHHLEFCQLI